MSEQSKTLFVRNMWDKTGMFLIFIIIFTVFSFSVNNFFSTFNMISLALAVSTIGIVACSMLFCLASGDFDLSVGSVVACAGVLTGLVINQTGSIALGITAGLLGGALVGFINGFIVAKCKINALITTLAMMQIVRGVGLRRWAEKFPQSVRQPHEGDGPGLRSSGQESWQEPQRGWPQRHASGNVHRHGRRRRSGRGRAQEDRGGLQGGRSRHHYVHPRHDQENLGQVRRLPQEPRWWRR